MFHLIYLISVICRFFCPIMANLHYPQHANLEQHIQCSRRDRQSSALYLHSLTLKREYQLMTFRCISWDLSILLSDSQSSKWLIAFPPWQCTAPHYAPPKTSLAPHFLQEISKLKIFQGERRKTSCWGLFLPDLFTGPKYSRSICIKYHQAEYFDVREMLRERWWSTSPPGLRGRTERRGKWLSSV